MILLIKPPYNPVIHRVGESLGLGILGAVLQQSGIPVRVLDMTPQGLTPAAVFREIKKHQPRLMGLSITCAAFLPGAITLAQAAKQLNGRVHVTVGGPYPSFAYEKILRTVSTIDSVIRFEGEIPLPLLYRKLDQPHLWDEIPSLCFRDQSDEILTNTVCPPVTDLDSLPWPLRSPASFGPGARDVTLLSSRGCPWNCRYCNQSHFYQKCGWRGRTAQNVVNEMRDLITNWQAGAFLFNDDNFIGSTPQGKMRALDLAALIQQRAAHRPWAISCVPQDVDLPLFDALQSSGLRQVFLGVESGVQSALDRWNNKSSVAQNSRAVEIIRDLGLGLEIGFMAFDPYTTMAELKANVEFLATTQAANPACLLNRLEVHDGMSITDQLKQEGRLREEHYGYRYEIVDEHVERAYRLMHEILPVLADAEHACQGMRFDCQIKNLADRQTLKQMDRLTRMLSDCTCQAAQRIIRFAETSSACDQAAQSQFVARQKGELWQFNREFRASCGVVLSY